MLPLSGVGVGDALPLAAAVCQEPLVVVMHHGADAGAAEGVPLEFDDLETWGMSHFFRSVRMWKGQGKAGYTPCTKSGVGVSVSEGATSPGSCLGS